MTGLEVSPPMTEAKAASRPATTITTSKPFISSKLEVSRHRPETPLSSKTLCSNPRYSKVLAASQVVRPSAVPAETTAIRPAGALGRARVKAVRDNLWFC